MASSPTVSVAFVRTLIGTLEQSRASRADLFAWTGLDPRMLHDPTARLALEEFEQLLEAAAEMTGDAALGLHMAEQLSVMSFGILSQLAAYAPTLREAIAIGARFTDLALDGMHVSAHDASEEIVIRCAFPRASVLWDRTLAELIVAGLARLAYAFVGPSARPRRVSFEHERPAHGAEYTRLLGDGVCFGRTDTSIVFDRRVADHSQMHQNPQFYALLQGEAERGLEEATANPRAAARLRQHLLGTVPSRTPDIASAARHLGMSERSLRRQLAAEGTSYRALVQSALETSASRLLRDPACSIKELAATLGFAGAPAFVRAFKRWTGTTPGSYRRARQLS